ncbi:low molecular weight protein-tyrosine-phosphatase [Alkalimarinus coralli]|uniref:low molecular weight protein-tyrosine-phosphatase n=1 Tax=Alkalimarinus coralli TaxID=2935863 RepID=UPI00202B0942|nr:low molecular weight protein-tyrosine-phosphatase [Alkalimarinus coralli]
MVRVLFVCLGNICRSPTAHGVFEHLLEREGLAGAVMVDSAGTGAWHAGNPPDKRAQLAAQERGYDLSSIRARQVEEKDFEVFDYILAMDKSNRTDLFEMADHSTKEKISLLLDFADNAAQEVPDPYYGGDRGFNTVLDLVEEACEGLLRDIKNKYLLDLK